MKASEKKIKDLFSEAKTFFAIPVYQRDYNWQEKHCKQLFEDILSVGKDIDMIIGNGYTKGHDKITLQEIRENPAIREVFEKKYV